MSTPGISVLAALLLLGAGCGGSRDKLLAELQSPRPEERALAVKRLAEQERADDLVLFTRAAKDPAAIVRAEAVAALAQSQDLRVVDLLGELLGDPDESVQGKAAMALAQLKSEKSKQYLTSQYGRRGRATRTAIVQALKAANVPGAMAAVVAEEAKGIWERNLSALTSGALPERVAAAEELGRSGRAEAVNRLLPLTRDSHIILAAAAVRGLGYAGDPRVVPHISALMKENFPELREAASESLLRLQDPQALPALLGVAVEKSAASPLATAAIIALPRGEEANSALCTIAVDGAPREALGAAREMRERGGCPLGPIDERLARSSTAASGLQAVVGLGPPAKGSVSKVLPFLASSDANLRLLAVQAVTEVRDGAALAGAQRLYEQELERVEALRADWVTAVLPKDFAPGIQAGSGPPNEQARQQEALYARVKELNAQKAREAGKLWVAPRAPSELVDDASTEELELLAATIRALAALESPDALPLLERHAQDPSSVIRAAAYAGLAGLTASTVGKARAGLLDPSREVQSAAAEALAAQGPPGRAVVAEVLGKLIGDRLRLLDALDKHGATGAATGPLLEVLRSGGSEASVAAQLLGRLGTTDSVDGLLKALADSNGVARKEVLWALGRLGDPRSAEVIARELNHDSPEIRAAAAQALARVGTPAQVEALDALKGDYYLRVREAAQAALDKLGGASAEAQK